MTGHFTSDGTLYIDMLRTLKSQNFQGVYKQALSELGMEALAFKEIADCLMHFSFMALISALNLNSFTYAQFDEFLDTKKMPMLLIQNNISDLVNELTKIEHCENELISHGAHFVKCLSQVLDVSFALIKERLDNCDDRASMKDLENIKVLLDSNMHHVLELNS